MRGNEGRGRREESKEGKDSLHHLDGVGVALGVVLWWSGKLLAVVWLARLLAAAGDGMDRWGILLST